MPVFLELISCAGLFLVFLDINRVHWKKLVTSWLIMVVCLFLVFRLVAFLGFGLLIFLPFFSALPFLVLFFTKKRS